MLRRFRVDLNAGEVAGVAFGEPADPVRVLFLHANGFNAITYQSILQPLGGIAHVAAMDMRGHGRTRLPVEPDKMLSWNRHRDDVIEVIEKMAPEGVVLSGHSMGATVALLVAARRPDLVHGLVMADPVLLSPQAYVAAHLPVMGRSMLSSHKLARMALKRRRDFESPEHAEAGLRGKGPFATWRTPFLQDYLVDGVIQNGAEGWRLSCSPEWEAACFGGQKNRPWNAFRKLGRADFPVILLQAEKGSAAIPDTDERVHVARPDAAVTRVPGTTHFLPMERPYVVRDAIRITLEEALGMTHGVDYVGAVRRTINDNIGEMG